MDVKENICPTCGERTDKKVSLYGVDEVVNVACACRRSEIEKNQKDMDAVKVYNQREALIRMGYPDTSYLADTFERDDSPDSKASKDMRRYVEKWPEMKEKNIGLLLCGGCGTGKTFYASCIANEVRTKHGDRVYISNLPTMVDEMKKNYGENAELVLKKIQDYPLLVIDDLGVERKTSTSNELAERIINARCRAKKPLIVTTNFTIEQFGKSDIVDQQRIFSRITEMCVPYTMSGDDRRKPHGNSKAALAKELLGI